VHELSITQSIVDAVAERLPDAHVLVVRLEIGVLAGVVIDSVRFCFDLVTEGTNLAGARLWIDEPAGRFRCRRCAAEFEHGDLLAMCGCGSTDLTVLAGQELRIRSVELAAGVS
jgi:hydrogenase nickel incorporation protein HypA/HybF